MNPTSSLRILLALALWACLAPLAVAGDPIPRPAELERDVQFWVRVYTEVNTDSGFLHDERNLGVVYETLRFAPKTPSRDRQPVVDAKKDEYAAALRRIAASTGPLSAEDQRIRNLWGPDATSSELLDATQYIRFQLGQSDRFRAGLERSGAWQSHIADTFASHGLPAQLAVLPHVESSFNPAAYSKVGAAGLWQFMRSTGRRYMRIDNSVDERLDPFRATEAAAQLLSYNYRLLGTWPLALTAYNHGAAGMRRAKEAMGTDDIVKIARHHKSPSFGFASRNFYVSFLAALVIDSNPDKYFRDLERATEVKFQEVRLPANTPASAIVRAVKVDRDELRELNPGIRPAVWQGQRKVPAGYRLRLPLAGEAWTEDLLAKRLGAEAPLRVAAAQPAEAAPSTAAAASPTAAAKPAPASKPVPKPAAATAAASPARAAPAPAKVAAPVAGSVPTVVAQIESAQDAKAVAVVGKPAARAQPVTAAQADDLGPSLGPAIETPQSADPIDYSITNDSIAVAADETLGHYAEWLGTTAARLRQLNKMKFGQPVLIGRRIKLEFGEIPREDFEQQRREYHRVLQASFFAAHRIVGTDVYTVRRGDSLWTVRQRSGQLPVWLLQQYNPDVDMGEMRAGVEIVVPKVEEVATSG
jgi:membrane-bound lytic murein transglycosylase D